MKTLARDLGYVLPGLPIAIFSFSLLLAMFAVSLATLVVWVGALLLPMSLVVASGFAELDRARLRRWGMPLAPAAYRRLGPGVVGKVRILADPRRWLDLVFGMLIAFPVRLLTTLITLLWGLLGLGLSTYFFWSLFVPGERNLAQLLRLIDPQLVPSGETAVYLLDSGAHLLLGVLFLVTLRPAVRTIAQFDAGLTVSLLGAEQVASPASGTEPDAPQTRSAHSFSGMAWSWIGAGFAAVVLLAVGWPVVAVVYEVPVAVVMVIVLAHCGALLLTLRWAWLGLALSLTASGATMLATGWQLEESGASVWPWPVTTLITHCAVLVVAALSRPWYYAAAAWSGGVVLTLSALLGSAPDLSEGAVGTSIVASTVSAAVVVVGALSRLWIVSAGRLEVAERTSAEQDRRRQELQERNRIARELHDVVAHSMSVISVQAATARYRIPGMDAAAQREFEEIAGSSREALGEMRMLLSVLRAEDDAPTAPEPGLRDIDALIESTRASGTQIRYSGLSEQVPQENPATGLAAYRAVQEALSNALRHAPGAAVDVALSLEKGHRLRVEVVNEAPPRPPKEPAPGAGLGLSGIRERVGAVGGSVQMGPTPEGGFAVRARLLL